jgi:hypothetical protein
LKRFRLQTRKGAGVWLADIREYTPMPPQRPVVASSEPPALLVAHRAILVSGTLGHALSGQACS